MITQPIEFPLVRRRDPRLRVADELHDRGDVRGAEAEALEPANGVEGIERLRGGRERADHAFELIDARAVDAALADHAGIEAQQRLALGARREVELDRLALTGVAIECECRSGDERGENGDGSQREFPHGILLFAGWKSKVATCATTKSIAYYGLIVKVKSWPRTRRF